MKTLPACFFDKLNGYLYPIAKEDDNKKENKEDNREDDS